MISLDEAVRKYQGDAGISPQPTQQPEKKSIFQKIGEFVAPLGRVLGESVAVKEAAKAQEKLDAQKNKYSNLLVQAIGKQTDPTKKAKLVAQLQRLNAPTETIQEQTPGFNTTNRQVAGAGLITGLNALGGGRLAGTTGSIGARLTSGTVQGGLYGAGAGLEQNQKGGSLLGSTAFGAGAGLLLSGVGEALGAGRRALERRPAITAERAVGVPKQALQPGEFYPESEKIGTKILSQNYKGGLKNVVEQAADKMDDAGIALDKALKSHTLTQVNPNGSVVLKSDIQNAVNSYLDEVPTASVAPGWQKALDKMPDIMSPEEANAFKISFANKAYTNNASGVAAPIRSESKMFYKVLADSLRTAIDESTGDKAIRAANLEWSKAFNTRFWASNREALLRAGGQQLGISPINWLSKVYYKTIGSARPKLFTARMLQNVVNPELEGLSQFSSTLKSGIERGVTKKQAELNK